MSIKISPAQIDNCSATDILCSLLTSVTELGINKINKEFVSGNQVSHLFTQILTYALCKSSVKNCDIKIMAATLKKDLPNKVSLVPDKEGMLIGFAAISTFDGISQIKYLSVLERYRGIKIASKIIAKSIPKNFPVIAGIDNSLSHFYEKNKFNISPGKDSSWKVAHKNLCAFDAGKIHSIEVDITSDLFMEASNFLMKYLFPRIVLGKESMRRWEGWGTYFSMVKKIQFNFPLLENNLRYGQKNGPISINKN
ncbi:GNAT family N-acetyltransferase [Aeromonas veronii]|uniref:GNAT family N-acetyltransferase n=1 Tax=Aeromonas veronii TaxID=654 RepID=UPI003F742E09